jgi:uncharacterized membrane protein
LLLSIRLFTILAMAVSAYLAWVSLSGNAVVGCGPDSGCDKVLQSRWAHWFRVPVSLFALGVYSLIFGASCRLGRSMPREVQRKAWGWLISCALLVAGSVVWFVGLQLFALHAMCPYCMLAHGSGFLVALLLLIAAPRRSPDQAGDSENQVFVSPRVFKNAALAALAGLAALALGQMAYQRPTFAVKTVAGASHVGQPTQSLVQSPVATNSPTGPATFVATKAEPPTRPRRLLPVYGGQFEMNLDEVPMIGASTNAHVAVSLFDYTCHHCRAMHPLLVEAQRMFSHSLAIVCLPMPLDPGCNPTMQRAHPSHTNACEYARLALTVWRANRARHAEFDAWLLEGEKPPPLADAQRKAIELVGSEPFTRACQDPWVEQQLKLDVAIYELAYRAQQGAMPQLILGSKVAVGSFLQQDLIKLLVENLDLKRDVQSDHGPVSPP